MTAACAACVAAPLAQSTARAAGPTREVLLALPDIHCAGCIRSAEAALAAVPGVAGARVNLSRRMASVRAERGVAVEDLTRALARAGHDAAELNAEALEKAGDAQARALLLRLAIAGFAAMNVMLLSVSVWSGAEAATRDLLHWIAAAIALPALAVVSQPFYRSAWGALRARRLNMDVPITLALGLAAAMSLYETAHGGEHAYYDAALSLAFFLLLGRYLERRASASARSAAAELTALETPWATRLAGDARETVRIAELNVGDRVLTAAGDRAPVDGVAESAATLDVSHLTGETRPLTANPGDAVPAGALNLSGPLVLRATAVGEDTTLRRTASLVAAAESNRGRYATLADRAAQIYAPAVHLIALIAFIGWVTATGDARLAITVAIATLIITCPCALGLAAPAVSATAASRLFRRGVLLKSGSALERLAEVDTVVFDKTGTLTEGLPTLANDPGDDALAAAAALARGSSHPYARAIAAAAEARGLTPPEAANVKETPGAGLAGVIDGRPARLGAAGWIGADDEEGQSAHLAIEGAAPLRFAFATSYRRGARELVAALKAGGHDVRLLSGDRPAAVARCAADLGIDQWRAGIDPAGKLAEIDALAAAGRRTLMVGDGLNDAGALAGAHVSAAPASGLDAARSAADIVLMRGDLTAIAGALATARSARRRILENFAIAGAYNTVSVPLAVAGFATPLMAALAMSTSSILVVLNALRVR